MSWFTPTAQQPSRIGRDLLPVGRLIRSVAGLALFVAAVLSSLQFRGSPPVLGGLAAVFVVCVVGYSLIVWLFGQRFFTGGDPWLLAILLVAPALVVQAIIAYGGCEVMGIPTLLVRRRYTVYCAMNGGDVVEHWLVRQPAAVHWIVSVLAFVGVIVLMGLASATGPKGLLVGYLLFLIVGLVISRALRAAARSHVLSQV